MVAIFAAVWYMFPVLLERSFGGTIGGILGGILGVF
jgi:hypothetical protein